MEVLTGAQHKALAFVGAANAGGYSPTSQELKQWLSNPTRRRSGSLFESFIRANEPIFRALDDISGSVESMAEHLVYLGWATNADSLRLTPLGRALLRSAEIEEASQPSVLVLDNEDPLAYIQLLGMLSDLSDALLVDPYLDAGELLDLMEFTGVDRVLMGDKDTAKKKRVAALLSKTPDPSVEVRYCSGLHDRMIIAGDGRVWMIGASLNTVSKRKSLTILTPMPKEAAEPLEARTQQQWEGASPLVQSAQGADPSTEPSAGDSPTNAAIGSEES